MPGLMFWLAALLGAAGLVVLALVIADPRVRMTSTPDRAVSRYLRRHQ